MADQSKQIKYQEMSNSAMLRRSTAIRGTIILVVLLGVFLVVNDLVLYNYLADSNAAETAHSCEEKNSSG